MGLINVLWCCGCGVEWITASLVVQVTSETDVMLTDAEDNLHQLVCPLPILPI